MSKVKKILISATISLGLLLLSMFLVTFLNNKKVVEIPVVISKIEQGEKIDLNKIQIVEVNVNKIKRDVFVNVLNKETLKDKVAKIPLSVGEIVIDNKVIDQEEYLKSIAGMAYVSLPVKSCTEGVSYKISKGDKINVYYTAKQKAVDNVIKSKTKIYSTNKEETMVTCLLYENVEIVALTNNLGVEVADGTITDIVVMLEQNEILEFVNLKEQGVFTYSLI